MADTELAVLLSLKNELSSQLRSVNSDIETSTKSWKENFGAIQSQIKQAGVALVGFGTAIIGALGYSYKLSEDQRIVTARLANELKNLGVAYDSVKDSLNTKLAAQQNSTGIGDTEQMEALSKLVVITGNYEEALNVLPTALDLAADQSMDTMQAALLLGRVIEGDINALSRYGFNMDGVTTSAQALEVIQGKVAGAAQSMVSPLNVLRAITGDLAEAIGDLLAPQFSSIVISISDVIGNIKEWIETHPELAKILVDIALSVGGAALAVGTLSLAVLGLAASLAVLGGPVTLVLLGMAAWAAMAIFVALNWDNLKDRTSIAWTAIFTVINTATYGILGLIFALQDGINYLSQYWDSGANFWVNIWNLMKLAALNAVNIILGILEGLVNGFLASLDAIAGAVNSFGKLIGQDWNLNVSTKISLPRITKEMWDIYQDVSGSLGSGYNPEWPSGILSTTPSDISSFGNYGKLGNTYTFGDIIITIDGENLSPAEIAERVREEFLKIQSDNGTTGLK